MSNDDCIKKYKARFEYRNGLLYIAQERISGGADVVILTASEVLDLVNELLKVEDAR